MLGGLVITIRKEKYTKTKIIYENEWISEFLVKIIKMKRIFHFSNNRLINTEEFREYWQTIDTSNDGAHVIDGIREKWDGNEHFEEIRNDKVVRVW